jgi:exodeoxyribonuclease-1
VHLNRCPALVDLRHVTDLELARLGIDRQRCLAHGQRLLAEPGLAERCRALFARPQGKVDADADVDQALYDALPERIDARLHAQIRVAEPEQLASFQGRLRDPRGDPLLFRYRARNWPQTLDPDERERWLAYRQDRLELESGLSEYSLAGYEAELDALASSHREPLAQSLLSDLRLWGRHLAAFP